MLGTSFFISGLISTFVFGWVTNKYGRKLSLVICYICGCISFLLLGYAPNYRTTLFCYIGAGMSLVFWPNSSIYL